MKFVDTSEFRKGLKAGEQAAREASFQEGPWFHSAAYKAWARAQRDATISTRLPAAPYRRGFVTGRAKQAEKMWEMQKQLGKGGKR